MIISAKTKTVLRLFHKYVGFIFSVFILQLTVTGILLLYPKFFGLNSTFVSNSFILKKYKMLTYKDIRKLGNNNDEKYQAMSIYLNGSQVRRDDKSQQYGTSQSSGGVQSITGVLDLAVSDYIEIYGKIDVNSGTPSFYGDAAASNRYSVLEIFKLVE